MMGILSLTKLKQCTTKIIYLSLLFMLPSLASAYTRDQLLPDATGVIAFNNIAKFKQAMTASCIGKIFHDKQLQKRFKNKTFFKLLLSRGDDSKAIKELTEQQFESFNGEFYLAIKYLSTNKISGLAVYEISEEKFIKLDEIDKKIHTLKKDKSFYDSYTFRGITINRTSYIEDGEKNIDYSAFIKGTAVDSINNQAWIERAVSRLLEELPEPQPADAAPYAKITINGENLLMIITDKLAEDHDRKDIEKMIRALGLNSLKSVTLNILPTPTVAEFSIEIMGLNFEQGLMMLIDTTPLPASQQLTYVDKNTFNYSVNRLNIKKICDNVTPIITAMKPDLLKQINAGLMTAEGMLGFNIYDKFVTPIGSIYTNYAYRRNGKTGKAFVFSLNDPKPLQQALSQIATKFPFLKQETFLNHTLYTLPGRANRPGLASEKIYGMTIANNSLSIGTIDSIHSILRRLNSQQKTARSFYQTDFFKRMHGCVPANAFGYTFYKLDTMLKILADVQSGNIISNKFVNLLANKLGRGDDEKNDLEHIASFVSNSVVYVANNNGTIEFNFKIFSK